MNQDETFPQIGETINKYVFETLLAVTSKSTRIYIAYSSDLKIQVVIKVISLDDADLNSVDTESQILIETSSMYVLNAIDLFNFKYKRNSFSQPSLLRFLVTPKIGNFDAFSFPKRKEYAKYIIYDTLKALQYLHGMNIMHRDIKPENIFISCYDDKKVAKARYDNSDYNCDLSFDTSLSTNFLLNNEDDDFRPVRAVLGDFGLAKRYSPESGMIETEEYVGTLQYCSPQVAVHVPYDESTDIWSLGATAYYLLYDKYPFSHSDSDEMVDIRSIFNCDYSFPLKDDVPSEAKDLICQMLQFSQDDRISVEDALHHVWFNDIIETQINNNDEFIYF